MPEITISGSICEACNRVFAPRVALQRFCCRQCSDQWWSVQRSKGLALLRQQEEQRA
jgi:hypothetical protein